MGCRCWLQSSNQFLFVRRLRSRSNGKQQQPSSLRIIPYCSDMVAAAGSDPVTTAVPRSPATATPIDEGEGELNSPRVTEPLAAAPPPAGDPLQQPGGDAWRNYGRIWGSRRTIRWRSGHRCESWHADSPRRIGPRAVRLIAAGTKYRKSTERFGANAKGNL